MAETSDTSLLWEEDAATLPKHTERRDCSLQDGNPSRLEQDTHSGETGGPIPLPLGDGGCARRGYAAFLEHALTPPCTSVPQLRKQR